MGIKFRKSIKIMPGVRINFSKSGMSTTIGPRGASVNIGPKGVYANAGIPGTGIYMREKIVGGPSSTSRSFSGSRGYDPEFLYKYEKYQPVTIKISNNGKIQILDKFGNVITDEFFLKKLKSTSNFKLQKEQLMSQWPERSEQEYQNAQNSLAELVNIHHYSFDVQPKEYYEEKLSSIKPQKYQMKAFELEEPSKHKIEISLTSYAELHITSKAFWRVKKLREKYVRDNLESQYRKQHDEWKKKKREFEQKQQKEAERQNILFAEEYNKCYAVLRDKINGDEDYVKENLEAWLSNSTLPVAVNVDYEYDAEKGNMYIDISLPSEQAIPQKEIVRLANGGVKEKAKTKQNMQAEYASMIFGLGICITSGVFDISPAIRRVLASGFATRGDKNGNKKEECLYSIKFERSAFEGISLRQENPIDFIGRFESRYKATQTWIFREVIPFDDF